MPASDTVPEPDTVPGDTGPQHLDLPRPGRLLRTAGWSLVESIGLPALGYVLGYLLAGQNVAVLAGTGILWLTVLARKAVTGGVPGMVVVTAFAMTMQAALVIATGSVWLFLLAFPLSHLALAVLFAWTAPTAKPLIAQLAGEVVSLRQPEHHHHHCLHRFFQGATWLWAGVFFALTACMTVLMVTEPVKLFLVATTGATVGLIVVGVLASGFWFFAMLRRNGLRLRFAAAG